MSVKERIKKFIEWKEISVREFERRCKFSYGYISNMRVSMQPDKIDAIKREFPELNIAWLITEEGEMLNNPTNNNEHCSTFEEPAPLYEGSSKDDIIIRLKELINEKDERLAEQKNRIKFQEEIITQLLDKIK